ncbi:TetR family transcriptional regulator [Allonocardiopsis opalescens]|uniref:TetR family transcriptional regulator n=1 Tax=Allonocardiopsis opalescens TaxID=1144618 RepID=A0A2T0Q4J2_9ACTN|nr:TetR family transcriptional regulator [Allonocardiopsis opalescens]PRX98728.1 TetR family transcriptional regulator [Allonocardiopsis opalescens]
MTHTDLAPRSRRDPRRRAELLNAAERAIGRDGPDVSMAAIAAEAGISKPILYRHFGDKSGLYRALAERHAGAVAAELRRQFYADGDLRARARSAIDAYLGLVSANLNLYRFLMHRATGEDAATRGELSVVVRRLGEEVAAQLVAERRTADPERARVLGHAVVGMVHAVGEWWLDASGVPRAQVAETLSASVAAVLLHGEAGG